MHHAGKWFGWQIVTIAVGIWFFFEGGNLILDNVSFANGLFISVVCMDPHLWEVKPKTLHISRIQLGKTQKKKREKTKQSGFVCLDTLTFVMDRRTPDIIAINGYYITSPKMAWFPCVASPSPTRRDVHWIHLEMILPGAFGLSKTGRNSKRRKPLDMEGFNRRMFTSFFAVQEMDEQYWKR